MGLGMGNQRLIVAMSDVDDDDDVEVQLRMCWHFLIQFYNNLLFI